MIQHLSAKIQKMMLTKQNIANVKCGFAPAAAAAAAEKRANDGKGRGRDVKCRECFFAFASHVKFILLLKVSNVFVWVTEEDTSNKIQQP